MLDGLFKKLIGKKTTQEKMADARRDVDATATKVQALAADIVKTSADRMHAEDERVKKWNEAHGKIDEREEGLGIKRDEKGNVVDAEKVE